MFHELTPQEIILFQDDKKHREKERRRGRILAGFGIAGMGVHGLGELANQTIGKEMDCEVDRHAIFESERRGYKAGRKYGKWGNRALLVGAAGMTGAGLYKANKKENKDLTLADWKRAQVMGDYGDL